LTLELQQGLIRKKTLTETDIEMIRQLAAACEAEEQLHMRIEWAMLCKRTGDVVNDFLYYVDGQLVGYLALDQILETIEVVGMVHPAYRRKRIFYMLLLAAQEECRTRGIRHLILICERNSYSGHGFLRALGASYSESEHEMILTRVVENRDFDERLVMHKADVSEAETIAMLLAASFEQNLESARRRVLQCLQDPKRVYYLAVFGDEEVGCHEPVGSLRIDDGDEMVGIYAFGVHPDYQGRGYGHQMLHESIHIIREQSQAPIMLDVDVQNVRAIHLYQSCGFDIRTTYDYYVIPVND
jgi:ribosomal protein S18 acetylase RimI-like enzyme